MRTLMICLIGALLAACGRSGPPSGDGVRVVVTVPPLAWAFEAALGDAAEVTVLLPAGGSPHGWEPTPSDLAAIARADLFVYVGDGHGLPAGLDRGALSTWGTRVWDADVLTRGEGWVATPGADEHPWLDSARVGVLAERASELGEEGEGAASWEEALLRVEAGRRETDAAGVLVLTGHSAWGAFFEGVGAAEVLAVRRGHHEEPSAAELLALRARAVAAERVLVVLERGEDHAWLGSLASELGAATVDLDPVGTRDWPGDMLARYAAVRAALELIE